MTGLLYRLKIIAVSYKVRLVIDVGCDFSKPESFGFFTRVLFLYDLKCQLALVV